MIISQSDLPEIRANNPESVIGLKFGCYDVLHSGHIEGLQFAREQAQTVVVGIIPDEMVARQKGPFRPIVPATARAERVDNLEWVDYTFVAPRNLLNVARAVRSLRPDVYIEHQEHAGDYGARARRLYLGAIGIKSILDTTEKTQSTTALIEQYGAAGALLRSASFS